MTLLNMLHSQMESMSPFKAYSKRRCMHGCPKQCHVGTTRMVMGNMRLWCRLLSGLPFVQYGCISQLCSPLYLPQNMFLCSSWNANLKPLHPFFQVSYFEYQVLLNFAEQ